jgi:hypothetical protein
LVCKDLLLILLKKTLMKINPTVNSQWFFYYYYYLFFFLLLFKVVWAQQPTVSHYSPTNKLMRCKLQVASCRVFMCTNNYLPHIKKGQTTQAHQSTCSVGCRRKWILSCLKLISFSQLKISLCLFPYAMN